ncbi:MAG: hypothetical protein RIT81_00720 [Deltaproteobacteria bacterium]
MNPVRRSLLTASAACLAIASTHDVAAQPRPTKRPTKTKTKTKQRPSAARPSRGEVGSVAQRIMQGTSPGVRTDTRLVLRYGQDVGFAPAAEDALAVGPDLLTAADGQVVALYDAVRNEILVATPKGVRSRFEVRRADALLIPETGKVAVLDASAGTLRLYAETGASLGDFSLPDRTPSGDRLELQGTSLVAIDAAGSSREVAQLVGGKLVPPTRTGGLEAPIALRTESGALRIGNETIRIDSAARIAGRLIGGRPPWIEIQIVRPGRRIDVIRRARRRGTIVSLPTQERSYVPTMDVAASSGGELVYLEPRDAEVHVVWVTP